MVTSQLFAQINLKKIDNKPLLQYQIERIKKSELVNQIVIATTKKKQDQKIINLGGRVKFHVFKTF